MHSNRDGGLQAFYIFLKADFIFFPQNQLYLNDFATKSNGKNLNNKIINAIQVLKWFIQGIKKIKGQQKCNDKY